MSIFSSNTYSITFIIEIQIFKLEVKILQMFQIRDIVVYGYGPPHIKALHRGCQNRGLFFSV